MKAFGHKAVLASKFRVNWLSGEKENKKKLRERFLQLPVQQQVDFFLNGELKFLFFLKLAECFFWANSNGPKINNQRDHSIPRKFLRWLESI